jgi:hypothetical protein
MTKVELNLAHNLRKLKEVNKVFDMKFFEILDQIKATIKTGEKKTDL